MSTVDPDRPSIWRALREGDALFHQRGEVYEALQRLARRLNEEGIAYALIGGLALISHGYRRYTEDIDVLLTAEGLAACREMPRNWRVNVRDAHRDSGRRL